MIFNWVGFVLRAPGRHKLLSAAAFLFVFGFACFAAAVYPARYQVQGSLLAGYPQASALSNPLDRAPNATVAAREVLLRRENLREILRRTNFIEQYLEARPWAIRMKDKVMDFIRGEPRALENIEEGLLDTLERRLWVEVWQEGTLVITFQWWDPELARQIVAASQESFLRARRAIEVDAFGEAIEILEAQRVRLDDDIRAAIATFEKKQEQLRADAPRPARPAPRPAAPDPEVPRLQAELARKAETLAEIERSRRQRTSQLQAELVQQEAIYASNHPAIQSTRRILQSLSEPNPRVIELQGEIERLEREIARRGGRASARVVATEPYLEARLRLDLDDPRLDFERGQLENLLRQHADLRNRIQSVQVEKELAEAAFSHRYSVITPPQIPRGPVRPYPLIFIFGGLMGGVALALFASTAADLRSGLILERWQVEDQLSLPVLFDLRKRLPGD